MLEETTTTIDEGTDADVRVVLESNGVVEAHRLIDDYTCWRTREDNELQRLRVQIYDLGPKNPNARYMWEVSAPDAVHSEPVDTNPASSVIAAGHGVHWRLLDSDGRRNRADAG